MGGDDRYQLRGMPRNLEIYKIYRRSNVRYRPAARKQASTALLLAVREPAEVDPGPPA